VSAATSQKKSVEKFLTDLRLLWKLEVSKQKTLLEKIMWKGMPSSYLEGTVPLL
jgi:hypothetical protein